MAPKAASILLLPLAFNLVLAGPRCPAQRSMEAPVDPEVTDNPACPGDHGKITKADDGSYFQIICCTHENSGSTHISTVSNIGSYAECLNLCTSDAYPDCNSAKYGPEKQCIMYGQGEFSTVACGNDMHDWLYMLDPPTEPAADEQTVLCSTECPTAHGQKYVSEYGELFHMECGKRHGTVPFRSEPKESFRDCMDGCADIPKCNSVDYSSRMNTCYYGTHSGAPPVIAPGYFSAYSLGCGGACEKDGEECCCGKKKCSGRGAGSREDSEGSDEL